MKEVRRRARRNPPQSTRDAREAPFEPRCTEKRGEQFIVIMFVVQLAIRFWWRSRVFR